MGGSDSNRCLPRAGHGATSRLLVFDTSHEGSNKAHRDQRLLLPPRVSEYRQIQFDRRL